LQIGLNFAIIEHMKKKIPKELQPLLWSKSVGKLDLGRDRNYIIHQILSYGDLKHLRWLFKVYKNRDITDVFVRFPQKIYQPSVFYFVKNFILHLKTKKLKEKNYAKNLF